MASSRSQSFKVVLLGEGRVGKTSLVLRFCRDTFVDGQPPTIQASCLERALRLGDKTCNLVIWDTAGQERFHALGPIYYRDADAALLVYDITDTDSFKRIQVWVRELRKMVGADIQLSIAGNKIDLERQRVVSRRRPPSTPNRSAHTTRKRRQSRTAALTSSSPAWASVCSPRAPRRRRRSGRRDPAGPQAGHAARRWCSSTTSHPPPAVAAGAVRTAPHIKRERMSRSMTDCARNAHDEPGRSRVSMTAEGHVRARTPQPKARRGAGESARDDTDLRVP